MDKARFAHHWDKIRGPVKTRWNRLTDRDLTDVGGNVEVLIGKIQEKYDEPRKAIEMQLARFVEEAEAGPR